MTVDVKRVFGANLKRYRKKAGMSQEDLAEKLEVTSKHLSNIEVGQKFISAGLLEKIAGILGVSPSVLFYSPEEAPTGDDLYAKVDSVLEQNVQMLVQTIKRKIRE
jgi:transcriptional regulator with XRE-family HTH domain